MSMQKQCPRCGCVAALQARLCAGCGHTFRTQFAHPDVTRAMPAAPAPVPPVVIVQVNPQPGAQNPAAIQATPGTHSPWVALLLSVCCLLVGGQLYNRQYVKAVTLLLAAMLSAAITAGVSIVVTWLVCPLDAWCVAQRINRGEPVSQWQFF